MNRRKFLTLTGIATAIIALPAVAFVSTSVRDATAATIYNELNYLNLEKEGVEKFVDIFLAAHKPDFKFKAKVRGAKLLGVKASDARLGFNLSEMYLLSTDFFRNKMDERKVVKFVKLYDPYNAPCSNPFSALFYPPDNA